MTKLFYITKFLLPAILWAIFIYTLCLSSNGGFKSDLIFGISTDKLGHAFIFSVLVFFIMQGLSKYWRFPFLINKIRWIAVIVSIVYAIVIEIVQHYCTVDRIGDYWDLIADIIGCFAGLLMFHSVYGNLKFMEDN